MKHKYHDLADSLAFGTWAHEADPNGTATAEDINSACLIDIMRSLRSIVMLNLICVIGGGSVDVSPNAATRISPTSRCRGRTTLTGEAVPLL